MEENNIEITEQDIFLFIFSPDKLSEEKRNKLRNDKAFDEAISFYQELKESMDTPIDLFIKKEIAKKIPAYTNMNIIELYPLKEPVQVKNNHVRLAAASKELKAKLTTKTFVDNNKEYLIKVLNYGETTKIFVFSTNDELVKNFDIVIEPEHLRYHFKDNSEPLKIGQLFEAQSIQLEIFE